MVSATTAKCHVSDGSFLMFTGQDHIMRVRNLERAIREPDLHAKKNMVKGQVFRESVVLDSSGALGFTAGNWFW